MNARVGKAYELVNAYLAGDEVAMRIIDTAVDVTHVRALLRDDTAAMETLTGLESADIASECDTAIDGLCDAFVTATERGWMVLMPVVAD